MSLSNPSQSKIPSVIEAYTEFKAKSCNIKYYDVKNKEEKFYDIKDLSFVILDMSWAEISGYVDEPINSRPFQAKNAEQEISVFEGKNLIAKGKWKEIKETVNGRGGHYHKLIYCYCPETDHIVLIKIKKKTIGFFETMIVENAIRESDVFRFKFANPKEERKGANKYFQIEFEGDKVSDDSLVKTAIEKDKAVQVYLENFKK